MFLVNYGPFWTNVLDYWERRYDPNVLFIKYEDMKHDLVSVIRKVSDFLITRQLTDTQISKLVEHLSFQNMQKNRSVNYEDALSYNNRFIKNNEKGGKFMRSGKVDSYKEEMSTEMEKLFDKWIAENTKDTNISF